MSYTRVDSDDIHESSRRHKRHDFSVLEVLYRVSAILTPILLTVICILLIVDYAELYKPSSSSELLGAVQTRYGSNFAYMTLDHNFDDLWDEELHPQNGIIRLQDGSLSAISMFHQIHCLTSFRKALQNAREGNEIGIDFRDDEHWPHCLWYLKQAILCFADDTLERPMKVNGSNIITGQDDLHQCRDSGKLYALREERGIWKEP
ncbi:hypothetical protein BP6252_13656 [Coleophoma cylindrospora]|uniref:Uncharacterized protein n=1 Tax=Coleophoma cylindrospora TaxID=1849047 RepID=A0A3D8Q8T1_9HELO|nr:hypothetical protein BP6252_13656 [Coleophoma cylindrospora]